ncbi:unnamed protein product [Pleuronectes platessa]|uniref:Uncharacterized protein n=1 Tax=Pleuronectes platessa TaxID=8262 RepID=A0A9N7UVI5_PLEPL|nr:unnamed protein product [Pleuronectes platessa]
MTNLNPLKINSPEKARVKQHAHFLRWPSSEGDRCGSCELSSGTHPDNGEISSSNMEETRFLAFFKENLPERPHQVDLQDAHEWDSP